MPTEYHPRFVTESMLTGFSRRRLITRAAAGAVIGSKLSTPLHGDQEDAVGTRGALPLPLPHISDVSQAVGTPAMPHFFFPGPVEGTAVPTDPTGAHADGRDPSTITNFDGFIGQV